MRAEKVTDEELSRAKNGYETSFVRGLESVRQRASILNLYEAEVEDPGYAQKDLDRYRRATRTGSRSSRRRCSTRTSGSSSASSPKKRGATEG